MTATAVDSFCLTAVQKEVLKHRLEVPDAITDSLSSVFRSWPEDAIHDAVEQVERLVDDGNLSVSDITTRNAAVLMNCVTRSTYFAAMKGAVKRKEESAKVFKKELAEANLFADWLSNLLGVRLCFPEC